MRNHCTATLSLITLLSFAAPAHASLQAGGEWVELELPSDAPERWVLSLPWGGEELEVDLWRSPIRAAEYRVRETSADGSLREVLVPPPATYHGAVRGDASRGAALAFVLLLVPVGEVALLAIVAFVVAHRGVLRAYPECGDGPAVGPMCVGGLIRCGALFGCPLFCIVIFLS